MRKILAAFCVSLSVAFFTTSCGGKTQEINFTELYPEIEGECVFKSANQEDVIDMLSHGTGIVFLSWKECPWCQRYAAYLNKTAKDAGLTVLYYDIYADREGDTEFYKSLVDILVENLDQTDAYDAAGKARIYVPALAYVVKGEIVGFDNETSMNDSSIDINIYWAETAENGQTREYNLKRQMCIWSGEVCEALAEINARGCNECEETCEN